MSIRSIAALNLCVGLLSMPAYAASTDYVIGGFTLTQGTIAPTAGRFTYDPNTGFSGFSVDWYGATINLTAAANSPTLFTTGLGYSIGTHIDSFALLTKTLPGPRFGYRWDAYVEDDFNVTVFEFGSEAPAPGGETFVFINVNLPPIGPDTNGVQLGGYTVTAVPEPSAVALFLLGLMGISMHARRSRNRRPAATADS